MYICSWRVEGLARARCIYLLEGRAARLPLRLGLAAGLFCIRCANLSQGEHPRNGERALALSPSQGCKCESHSRSHLQNTLAVTHIREEKSLSRNFYFAARRARQSSMPPVTLSIPTKYLREPPRDSLGERGKLTSAVHQDNKNSRRKRRFYLLLRF